MAGDTTNGPIPTFNSDNFIAANFITKATEKEGIKPKSVYNLFSDTDKKVANYWVDILKKMLEDARKV